MSTYGIAIHGGAGTIDPQKMTAEKESAYKHVLSTSLQIGYDILENKGTAMDAVETAVKYMEDSPLFNAGKGSVFTNTENIEMDASIMEGRNLKAGAVAAIKNVRNPISLARLVMEKTDHVMLIGDGALEFAKNEGVALEPGEYFFTEARFEQLQKAKKTGSTFLDHSGENKFGTVGAVALDASGDLAAATSTGGLTNKKWGRVGDTPIIGAGTYANNDTCAVSCTGDGEFFIRGLTAYDLSAMMEYLQWDLGKAGDMLVHQKLIKLGGMGGLIAIDKDGSIIMPFNTTGMYRGARSSNGYTEISIYN